MNQSTKYWPAHLHQQDKRPSQEVRQTVLQQVIAANARLPKLENDKISVFFNGIYQGKV